MFNKPVNQLSVREDDILKNNNDLNALMAIKKQLNKCYAKTKSVRTNANFFLKRFKGIAPCIVSHGV